MNWFDLLFYVAFISQIFLISYYMPNKMLARMQKVFADYPPSEYPKLYPQPVAEYKSAHRAFRMANRVIALIGVGIVFALIFVVDPAGFTDDGFISEAWPAGYGLLQFIPSIWLELSEFSQMKQMRLANTDATRRAVLKPRRLLEYVSPKLISIAIAAIALVIFYIFYVNDFNTPMNQDFVRLVVLVLTNAMLFGIAAWQWYGRRLDPHLSNDDRMRRAAAGIRSMLYVSIALSVYYVTAVADSVYDLDFLDAILLSVYFQVIVVLSIGNMLRSVRLDEVDFDVYRSDTAQG